MKNAWRVGRIAGIEIKIDSSWLVIFLLFTFSLAAFYFPHAFPVSNHSYYWFLGVVTSLLVFASVLFHELAHSVVARKQGEKVEDITLFILGGVARISEELQEPKKGVLLSPGRTGVELFAGRSLFHSGPGFSELFPSTAGSFVLFSLY